MMRDVAVVGGEVPARVTVNCAGVYADEVARLWGDDSFEIFPLKGEFAVFDGVELDRVLFPPPDPRTRGVLVFPTVTARSSPAGLRPAGRGCNYVIRRHEDLVNVAAIRSTGLSACHGIAELVAAMVVPGATEGPRPDLTLPPSDPWWSR
jgi:glycerol-3-phosphate dehydrogenase